MTTGPINPVEAVAAAKRAGLIREGYEAEIVSRYNDDEIVEMFSKVRLPSEVGLQVIRPTPKPAPCKLLKRAKREAGNRKYIITKKDRPELFK